MCSGLCEIKDTGDSALASSDPPHNIWAVLYSQHGKTVQTNLGRKYLHALYNIEQALLSVGLSA